MVDVSSTCAVYVPVCIVPPLRSSPHTFRSEIVPPFVSSIVPISVPPRVMQSFDGGGSSFVGSGDRRSRCRACVPRAQASSPQVSTPARPHPIGVALGVGTWSWMYQSGDAP